MSTLRLNYDGWLALPTAVRKKLGLTTGDQLEFSGDSIILRPRRSGCVIDREAEELPVATVEPTASPLPPPAAAADPIVKRGPGRPRKAALSAISPTLKARGGKRKVPAAPA